MCRTLGIFLAVVVVLVVVLVARVVVVLLPLLVIGRELLAVLNQLLPLALLPGLVVVVASH